jgi:serine/threonine-protein kinase
MPANEQLLNDLAGAVLDGTDVDWRAVESDAEDTARPLLRHLQLVASVARVHRDLVPLEDSMATTADPTAAPDRWGHLRILERIGGGAFGEVFRAWDPWLDREVALKLLAPSPASVTGDDESIIREGQLLARVRHDNVVTIYGAERIGGRIGLWMEFIHGRTLEQQLKERTTFPAVEVVDIGIELCRAVHAVHAAGVLHRDIKAHNVVRADDGRVVLMDFGTGRELDDNPSSDLAGTPLYLAPEVLNGESATVRSDVYSVGVLLYHLITGAYPVRGRTIREVRRAHETSERTGILVLRPRLRPALARIIERATEPLPERRYETVEALAAALKAVRSRTPSALLRYGATAAAAALIALVVLEAHARFTGDPHRRVTARLANVLPGAAVPAAHVKMAVLPFRNVGRQPDTDLVDRLTFSLIGRLGLVEGLHVRGASSSFMLKDGSRTIADISRLLDVNHTVRGDATISDGRLRLHASLAEVGGRTLWSGVIERQLESEGDLVTIVEQVTTAIVNRLRLEPGRRAPSQLATADLDTFRKYLKAHELLDGRGQRARDAIALYDDVLKVYPNYAPALAELATTYGYLGIYYPDANATYMRPAEAMAQIQPLVRKALDIDPYLAQAHAAQGLFDALGLRWREADASFQRALELDPTGTHLSSDFALAVLQPLGKLDEAARLLAKALQADPLSLDARRTLCNVQLHAGLYVDALNNCQQVLDVDPAFPFARQFSMWARLFNGDRDDALAQLEQQWAAGGRLPGPRGWIHAIKGERVQAEAIAVQFAHLPQRQAEIYGLLGGESDRVLEALGRLALMNPVRAGYELSHPAVGLQRDPRVVEFRRTHMRFPE